MHTTAINYKLIKKIKDDRFDEEKIHQYTLLINIGTKDLQVGVADGTEERMLLLEDYVFPSLTMQTDLMSVMDRLFDAHPILKAAFWKQIRICIKNNKFVQVPEVLFISASGPEYLKYNAQVIPDEEDILHIHNPRAEAVTVYSMQKGLKSWFDNLYAKNPPVYMHQSSALIEGFCLASQQNQHSQLYIYVDRFRLHILACIRGKLLYYNQFIIRQFSDYIRYIMLVMKSLKYDQAKSQVMLWGYVGRNSPHYHEFYKYISNVVFGKRPTYLKFGYMFDEVQDHHFFDLYSMYLLGNMQHSHQ